MIFSAGLQTVQLKKTKDLIRLVFELGHDGATMKKLLVLMSIFLFTTANHASWVTSLTKIVKGTDNAAAATKGAAGAKGAATTGLFANELDDAAKATRLNSAHPPLLENETSTIFNNYYPWAHTRLAVCISKQAISASNSSLAHCTSQYQKCIDERKIQAAPESPNEACITQTNKESRNEKK